jgi:23S rRNA pseudouridine1911/1915/1917 synthase
MKNSNECGIDFGKKVFKNEDYLIFDKKCGVAVQSADKSQLDLCGFLSHKLETEVFPITRIDQPVSGLILFALSRKAAATGSKLLQKDFIKKSYLAIVEGTTISHDSLKDLMVKKGTKSLISTSGKEASLDYKTLRSFERYSLLEIHIQTGRFHQIRAQLSNHGHPIKGDVKYGARRNNKFVGICLHCATLSLIQPENTEGISVESPWPESENWLPFK